MTDQPSCVMRGPWEGAGDGQISHEAVELSRQQGQFLHASR
jgi:hypothetical protein